MPRKKTSTEPKVIAPKKTVRNSKKINNAIIPQGIGGGVNGSGFPFNQGTGFSNPVTSGNSLFTNLRWYLISNDRQLLNEMFAEVGLVQTICIVPVQDALRGGIKVSSKKLDEEQISELLASLDRDDDINTCGWSEVWNRLFGGAGVLTLTDQDPEEPLDIKAIGPDTPLEFRAVDMWELTWDMQNLEGYDPSTNSENFEFYQYYDINVHKSRVMRLKGLTVPSFLRPRLRGWGLSVIEALVSSLNQYFKNINVSYEVMDEFKVDVYKIKNLVNTLMSPDADNAIMGRIQKGNFYKNFMNALVMDSEDDWDHKQLSFAGLGDLMEQIRMQVAADMRIPMNKLFGQSASGFSSGQDSIEVYNSMVESEVRNKIKYQILRVCELKCQKLFGFIPDDIVISFEPLRELSSVDEQTVKTQKFGRALQALQAGAISIEEFRDICNKSELFDLSLGNGNQEGGYLSDTVKENQKSNPYNPLDTDDPGSDRADSEKPKASTVGGIAKDAKQPIKREPSPLEQKAKLQKRENSAAFDKASYEASGGDSWFNLKRLPFYEHPQDQGLWVQAEQRTQAIYGQEHKPFTIWLYEKLGGKFHGEDPSSAA